MKKTAIFFASKNGITENVAYDIQYAFDNGVDIYNVADGISQMKDYDNLIIGTPTYGVGDLPEEWKAVIDELINLDLSDKTVALFSTGDQILFHESFVNGMGTLYELLKEKNVKFVGQTKTIGYHYEETTATDNGMFVGLVIDDVNQAETSIDRIQDWVDEIKKEL